jgi:hypothetical protein
MTFTRGYGSWPELGIWSTATCRPKTETYAILAEGTRTPAAQLGLATAGHDWFWRTLQRPATEPFDIDEYADDLATRLHTTWARLAPPVTDILNGLDAPPPEG